jgi:two-component system chemotaxis response regulator CheY
MCDMKILVVDDSLLDRKLSMNVFKKAGFPHDILQASDGEEALRILSQNYQDIALILLDWQMPKMDGIEFMRGVTKVPEVSKIPIIMITASSSDENKKLAYQVNPRLAGYVTKPYKPEQLMEAAKPFLG